MEDKIMKVFLSAILSMVAFVPFYSYGNTHKEFNVYFDSKAVLDKEKLNYILNDWGLLYKVDGNKIYFHKNDYPFLIKKLVAQNLLNENLLINEIKSQFSEKKNVLEKEQLLKELKIEMAILQISGIFEVIVHLENFEGIPRIYIFIKKGRRLKDFQKEDISKICSHILKQAECKIFFPSTLREFDELKTRHNRINNLVAIDNTFSSKNLEKTLRLLNECGIPSSVFKKVVSRPKKNNFIYGQFKDNMEFWNIWVRKSDYNKARLKLIAIGIMPRTGNYAFDTLKIKEYKIFKHYQNEIDFEYKLLLNLLQLDFIYECDIAVKYLPKKQVDVYLNIIQADEKQLEKSKQIIETKISNFLKKYNLDLNKIYF
jgi:hypothetical protein